MSENVESPTRAMTVAEFLAWADQQREGRFELAAGHVVAMAPERGAHLRAEGEAYAALRNAVRDARLACEVLPDGATVRIDDSTACEPDVTVTCGPRMAANDLVATEPVIVVEVTSPSKSRVDPTTKLADYFRLPSIQHHLVIHVAKRLVLHHRRGQAGEVTTRMLPAGRLILDPPGLALEVEPLFNG